MKKRVAFVLGTRPEAIKLAPVIRACRAHAAFEPLVVSTGQHEALLRPILEFFSIAPDASLSAMTEGQTLTELTSRILTRLDGFLVSAKPDVVVVQGDTTTAMAGALAAFYRRIPVAHVEAGLRTDNLSAPFPEELNRRIVGQIASLHLAPTRAAKDALVRDAVQVLGGRIVVTGNTVIDALLTARGLVTERPPLDPVLDAMRAWAREPGRRVVLVTGHRRESFGAPFEAFCRGLRDIAEARRDVLIVYPAHLNPNVQAPVAQILAGVPNVLVCPPKDYPTFVAMMLECALVVTDSGGVQEEAPALGKPVLVTRATTERPEGVDAGVVRLVGTDREGIAREVVHLLDDPAHYAKMALGRSPYGDGRAAARVVAALVGEPVEEFNDLTHPG